MGLDVTVFLGRLHESIVHEGEGMWFQVEAHVELAHEGRRLVSGTSSAERQGEAVFLYAPAGDGDKCVTEDRYGVRLRAFSLPYLRHLVDEELSRCSHERRGDRLAMLASALSAAPEWVTHAVVFCH